MKLPETTQNYIKLPDSTHYMKLHETTQNYTKLHITTKTKKKIQEAT